MKNTTGYGLNALTDFTDPVDILAHLMIGSEGTLGFISSITIARCPTTRTRPRRWSCSTACAPPAKR